MNVVISQPMYFPWVGMFEQVKLCNVYVHYDDVQFSKGSFTNRVQIKTNSSDGYSWLTVPLKNLTLGINIKELLINNDKDWKNHHLNQLKEAYRQSPFRDEMLVLVNNVFENQFKTIAELSQSSIEVIADYFGFNHQKFFVSSELAIGGASSQRVYEIVKHFKGDVYITGHGARKYLDHNLFEENGIEVAYMDYQRTPYPQQFGPFNPHVSILDLIANLGKEGEQYIHSSTKHWREFAL